MSFINKTRTCATFADVKTTLIEELVNAGWTDDSGAGEYKAHSAADAQGRRCYVKFTDEHFAGDGFDYLKVSTGREATFGWQRIDKYAYINEGGSFPDNDIWIYANEYWCTFYTVTDDGFSTYRTIFGLYEPKDGSTLVGEPTCSFQANPRDTAGGGATAVKWNDFLRYFYHVGSAGATIEGGLRGLNLAVEIASNVSTSPNRKLAIRPFLANSAGTPGWIGFLYYAQMIPDPVMTAGDQGDEYGTAEFYDVLPNANRGKDNLCVRIE